MSWTEKYLDLSAGSNGSGTSGSPWNTWANAMTGLGAISAATRLNVKGTASGVSAITFNPGGTSIGVPLWIRGYNTTIGDCSADFSLTRPSTAMASGNRINISTPYIIFDSLTFSGDYEFTGLLYVTASGPIRMFNVKSVNVFNGTAAAGCAHSGGYGGVYNGCHFEAHSGANGAFSVFGLATIAGSFLKGGAAGIYVDGSGTAGLIAMRSILKGATYGINVAVATNLRFLVVDGCTVYNPSSDGIRIAGVLPDLCSASISNMILDTVGGYGVKNTSGTTNGLIGLDAMLFHSITSGQCNGFVDDASTDDGSARDTKTDSSSPFAAAGSDDFSVVSGSNAKATGFPGTFDPSTTVGYLDRGAAQRQEPAASVAVQSLFVHNIGTY